MPFFDTQKSGQHKNPKMRFFWHVRDQKPEKNGSNSFQLGKKMLFVTKNSQIIFEFFFEFELNSKKKSKDETVWWMQRKEAVC